MKFFLKLLVALFIAVTLFAGSANASIVGGIEAYKAEDFTKALRKFKPLAERDDAEAQYYLGEMYYTGNGVVQNSQEACMWYKKAADQDNADAQNAWKELGIIYLSQKKE
jgi:TPR repeat protein